MELVDLPPLTALAAFDAVALDGVTIMVAGPIVLLGGAGAAESAERMWNWIQEWIDGACAEIFTHPAKRPRP